MAAGKDKMKYKNLVELKNGMLRAQVVHPKNDLLLLSVLYHKQGNEWHLRYQVYDWFKPYINDVLSAAQVTAMLLSQRFDPVARGVTVVELIERFQQGPPR